MTEKKVYTKGDVIVQEIKIGDIHYEYEYNVGIKSEVVTLPEKDSNGYWSWQSKNLSTGKIIEYGVHEMYSHYGPNLYNSPVYEVNVWM